MFVSRFFLVFLGTVLALFFLLPVKWRPMVLLFSSYVFCGWMDKWALIVLVFISVCSFVAGKRIERLQVMGYMDRSRTYTLAAVIFCILLLCIYKYFPYFLERFDVMKRMPDKLSKRLIMPVGLSFYLFQAIGYLTDIYRGKSKAETSFLYLGCYLAFFPKLVSGPIEREQDFLPQLKELSKVRFHDRGRWSLAFTYMLWGYFMKMVAADRLAVTVNRIFADPEGFDSFWLVLGMLFYTIQIYCDFAGYSYIAIGCARIFGINLTQNFKAPYQAAGIADFWRRWHISLSSWLRDYIYIPLGGNRRGIGRKCINTMAVFLVCGMWHGAGINFVAWGLLHGFYSVMEVFGRQHGWQIKGKRIFTFASVSFAWIFFRAGSFRAAIVYIGRMFTAGIHLEGWWQIIQKLDLNIVEIGVILVAGIVIWVVDEICSRKKMPLPELIQNRKNAGRYFIFYLLIIAIFIFGMYGPGYHAEQFIYMQF